MSQKNGIVGYGSLAHATFGSGSGGSHSSGLIEVRPVGENGFEFVDPSGSHISDNGGKYKKKNPGRKARGVKRQKK